MPDRTPFVLHPPPHTQVHVPHDGPVGWDAAQRGAALWVGSGVTYAWTCLSIVCIQYTVHLCPFSVGHLVVLHTFTPKCIILWECVCFVAGLIWPDLAQLASGVGVAAHLWYTD